MIGDCCFDPSLYYDDQYQVWVRREGDGTVTIGMTDLSQAIAGRILHCRIRKVGTLRELGRPAATLESGKWAGPVPNPLTGTIVARNEVVLNDPGLLNRDPVGEGWIVRMQPERLEEEILNLVTGETAAEGYKARMEREKIVCSSTRDPNLRELRK
ncbi:MAG: glycine cleavage system protein H [Alphaproteobacteria bacterium CG_4_10_14_0_2_um_filter_63_37]|nr:MAG: glycine cleavage system protein H [Proteobacteria bacterium CG1_02_64_396]PJA24076.1 MAG: glycine cleavage system protein H [Alphaproteobacteria bacterium CG_4_10_14_0_2_um_filter_63_37]